MKILPTSLPDVLLIEPRLIEDDPGFFFQSWNARDIAAAGIDSNCAQDSDSRSAKRLPRGLHYKIREPHGTLIGVVAGEVFNVVVEIRKSSPRCGRHVAVRPSAESRQMLRVPSGFARGFYVPSEHAEMLYKQTALYAPRCERSLNWNDPALAIDWPHVGEPVSPPKDRAGLPPEQAEIFP